MALKLSGPCRAVGSKTLVRNNAGATSTGTARARIKGLHSLLQVGIYLAFFPDTKNRPAAFTGNTFSINGYVSSEEGELVQLSSTPINNDGAGAQSAPDGWEGITTLPEVELVHSFTGISAANGAGDWKVVVIAAPATPMSNELFRDLIAQVDIDIRTYATAT